MFLSVDAVRRLPGRESALEVVDVGVNGGRCASFCRTNKGNFRAWVTKAGGLLGSSGMNGLDERPGKADRGVPLDVGPGLVIVLCDMLLYGSWMALSELRLWHVSADGLVNNESQRGDIGTGLRTGTFEMDS